MARRCSLCLLLVVLLPLACTDDPAPPVQIEDSADLAADQASEDGTPDLLDDMATLPDLAAPADMAEDMAPTADMAQPDMAPSPPGALAPGLTIRAIDAYQTVRVPLWGEPLAEPVPLIAGRQTLVRVFVESGPDAPAGPITAEFTVEGTASGQPLVLRDTRAVRAGTQADLASTHHVIIPSGVLTATSSLSVRLTVPTGGTSAPQGQTHPAAWPLEGRAQPLMVREDSKKLRVMLVPLRYDYDGSGRLPDLDAAQLARFESLLRSLYPYTDVELMIHDVIAWNRSVRFGNINQMLVQLKEDEQADDDLYYYALIKPADRFEDYCGRSCTTGQSYTTSDNADGIYRVGSGLGFGDEDRAWTLAHELGHMHGLGHAPCDVSFWNADGDYPYRGGLTGVWGWDPRNNLLMDPADTADMMGYCDEQWLSDYHYLSLFERAQRVAARNALRLARPAATWRFLSVQPDGRASWGRTLTARSVETGQTARVRLLDRAGRTLRTLDVPALPAGHDPRERDLLILADALGWPVSHIEVAGRKHPAP
jgi:hypothetical protein